MIKYSFIRDQSLQLDMPLCAAGILMIALLYHPVITKLSSGMSVISIPTPDTSTALKLLATGFEDVLIYPL